MVTHEGMLQPENFQLVHVHAGAQLVYLNSYYHFPPPAPPAFSSNLHRYRRHEKNLQPLSPLILLFSIYLHCPEQAARQPEKDKPFSGWKAKKALRRTEVGFGKISE